jgi:hypothetical protein
MNTTIEISNEEILRMLDLEILKRKKDSKRCWIERLSDKELKNQRNNLEKKIDLKWK